VSEIIVQTFPISLLLGSMRWRSPSSVA